MRIGILTFHRSPNDGSLIQAYCAQQFLKHHCPGAEVEIIDYIPRKMIMREVKEVLTKRPPFLRVSRLRRLRQVREFCRTFYRLSPRCVVTDHLGKATRFIAELQYDVICVGSDTVWRVLENENTPTAPNIYFLPNISGIRKIGFAVSCDGTDDRLLDQQRRVCKITECIEDFDYIGVRDRATRDYLQRFGILPDRIDTLPDPTVLWDFTEIVGEPLEKDDLKKQRIAGVAISCRVHKEKATRHLRDRGYVVYNLLGTPADGARSTSPQNSFVQRLGIYRYLSVLVTDRFHGSLFTLNLSDNAPVVFLESEERYPRVASKGRDLFEKLGIQNMVVRLSHADIDLDLLERTIRDWPCRGGEIRNRLRTLREDARSSTAKMLALIGSQCSTATQGRGAAVSH